MAFSMSTEEHRKYGEKALDQAEDNVSYFKAPDFEEKIDLYQNAKALVIPLDKDYVEAFGLVFVEALSCSTPVITANHGSVKEIVNEEVGFKCETYSEYKEAISNISSIDNRKCRELVEEKYSAERYAKNYLQLYEFLQGK